MTITRNAFLRKAGVWRGGLSQDTVVKEPNASIECIPGKAPWADMDTPYLKLRTSIASKGGGKTVVLLRLDSEDFEDVILAMVSADQDATLRAISTALRAIAGE